MVISTRAVLNRIILLFAVALLAKYNQSIGWALLRGMNKLLSEGHSITADGELQPRTVLGALNGQTCSSASQKIMQRECPTLKVVSCFEAPVSEIFTWNCERCCDGQRFHLMGLLVWFLSDADKEFRTWLHEQLSKVENRIFGRILCYQTKQSVPRSVSQPSCSDNHDTASTSSLSSWHRILFAWSNLLRDATDLHVL